MVKSIKMVLVIIATIVGAGFASGKEIYTFFFAFRGVGIVGIGVSSLIISFVIYKVLKICNENNIDDYQGFCEYIVKKRRQSSAKLSKQVNSKSMYLLNNVVSIFLLITFYVMISGFSSLLWQEFGINKILASIIIVVLCYLVFLRNISGLIKISNYLVPILICFIAIISLRDMNVIENYRNIFGTTSVEKITYFNGIIKSVLYACYNCIILIPVLIPLRKSAKDNMSERLVAIASFILVIILSFAIYNLLLQGNNELLNLEMPIVSIVGKYGNIYKNAYILIIGASIFTSAISTGYGFLNNCSKNKSSYTRNMILICITAIFISQISFSAMVEFLYPLLGLLGVAEIVLIFIK